MRVYPLGQSCGLNDWGRLVQLRKELWLRLRQRSGTCVIGLGEVHPLARSARVRTNFVFMGGPSWEAHCMEMAWKRHA